MGSVGGTNSYQHCPVKIFFILGSAVMELTSGISSPENSMKPHSKSFLELENSADKDGSIILTPTKNSKVLSI